MGVAQPQKRYTPEEYYALEREAAYKSDYYDGEIFAMAGGTAQHSLICSNLVRELGNRLKGSPCAVYESNLRLKVQATGLRCYPDVGVYCGSLERDQEDPGGETVTNPTVIFEVLSKSTEGYDRGLKFESYRQIPTLKAYVLVSQVTAHVEVNEPSADGSWILRDVKGIEATLTVPGINIKIPLAEIYDRITFPAHLSLMQP